MTGRWGRAWTSEVRLQFLRFAVVGGVGFAVDAAVLSLLIATGRATPIAGRLVSFACAVLVTFELNRRWSFGGRASRTRRDAFAAYIGVQGVGFLCNLALFSAAYTLLPPPLNAPLLCLALASGFALAVNFAGSRLIVFRKGEVDPGFGTRGAVGDRPFRSGNGAGDDEVDETDDRRGAEGDDRLGRCARAGDGG